MSNRIRHDVEALEVLLKADRDGEKEMRMESFKHKFIHYASSLHHPCHNSDTLARKIVEKLFAVACAVVAQTSTVDPASTE